MGDVLVANTDRSYVISLPRGTRPQLAFGAVLGQPYATAIGRDGDVFITDISESRVVKVAARSGAQTTVASDVSAPRGVAVNSVGDVYIADSGSNRVVKVSGRGGQQASVGAFIHPVAVAVDDADNLYVTDTGDPMRSYAGQVLKVDAVTGAQTVVADGLFNPAGLTVDADGDIFIADYSQNHVLKVPATGGAPVIMFNTGMVYPPGLSPLFEPTFLAFDAIGNLYVTDQGTSFVLHKFPPHGKQVTAVSGVDNPSGISVYAPAPTFTAAAPPNRASVGTRYRYSFGATKAASQPPPRFSVAQGSLPPGLVLNSFNGVLHGTPTSAGTYNFVVRVQNVAHGTLAPASTISVAPH